MSLFGNYSSLFSSSFIMSFIIGTDFYYIFIINPIFVNKFFSHFWDESLKCRGEALLIFKSDGMVIYRCIKGTVIYQTAVMADCQCYVMSWYRKCLFSILYGYNTVHWYIIDSMKIKQIFTFATWAKSKFHIEAVKEKSNLFLNAIIIFL